MSQPRQQFHMVGGNNFNGGGGSGHHHNHNYHHLNDTTYTKLFVGGLAWETQRETMRKYFEQFGEILEAVVITDKASGRSKGYGFVTFRDPEAAFRACQNPSPVIDGRRANCNLASLGATKNQPPTPQHVAGGDRFRATPGIMTAPAFPGSPSYFHQPPAAAQPPFPYSTYGYSGYTPEAMYQMQNYYGLYGQQYSPYYPTTGTAASGTGGYFPNFYPYYAPYAQSSQGHGFGFQQYPQPQMVQQYPFIPHHLNSTGILSLPTSPIISMPTTSTGMTATVGVLPTGPLTGPSHVSSPVVTSEQNSST